MKTCKKTAALFLVLSLLLALSAPGFALFDKTSLAGGVFQLNVVHNVEIPDLEDDSYTVWTSAVCFAAGRDDAGRLYVVTDASLSRPDRMFDTLGDQFIELLTKNQVPAAKSDLSEKIRIIETQYYLVYEGSLVALTPVAQTVSSNVLLLKPQDDVEATVFSYGYADTYQKEDIVHTFALSSSETDGFVSAEEDAYITNWSFTTRQGDIIVPATVEDGYISCTMADLPMDRASQGSPLFDDSGNVIGLNLWIDNCNQAMALTSSALMAILNQAGISYVVNEIETKSFPSREAFLYLGIAVVVIIVLLIVLIILHSRRKKLEEEDLSQLELEASRARAEYARAQSASREEKNAQANASADLPPVRPAAAQYESVTLTILDGPMKGFSMQIEDKATLGRDPEVCNVVFPPDAVPVSRRHCQVTFNHNTGRVLLEDLNSSNGTYFPSGTRIIPGRLYALRPGDRFYLGLPENLAEVRMV